MTVSDKANQIGESPTLKVTAKAKAMKAAGVDVIDLSVGEPDFPTPDNIKSAGKQAIDQDFTKYTQVDGTPALKEAIIRRLKEDLGLAYEKNEVIVSSGASDTNVALLLPSSKTRYVVASARAKAGAAKQTASIKQTLVALFIIRSFPCSLRVCRFLTPLTLRYSRYGHYRGRLVERPVLVVALRAAELPLVPE